MILPSLDHAAQNSQQWVTPELGLNSTRVKGFLTRLKLHRQQEGFHPRCLLKLSSYSLSFPTCLSHPRKCAPSLLNSPSVAPLPFQASTTGQNRKSQSTVVAVGLLQEFNSQQFSHLERVSHRPDNLPLQSHGPDNPLLQSNSLVNQVQAQVKEATKNGYGTGDGSNRKVQH
jgi:hypothetical protein